MFWERVFCGYEVYICVFFIEVYGFLEGGFFIIIHDILNEDLIELGLYGFCVGEFKICVHFCVGEFGLLFL